MATGGGALLVFAGILLLYAVASGKTRCLVECADCLAGNEGLTRAGGSAARSGGSGF